MHMADALVSPVVGGVFWAASGGSIAYCARALTHSRRDDLIPTMGVLGAFVFAAQMINVAIPGTGSSGHLGGGLLLAILLGPHAALLVMASVLTVQAFFFADGGLLALGCNIFNLGLIPAWVAYPFVYRPLAGHPPTLPKTTVAIILAAMVGLQLGALGVVLQTRASGVSELPLGPFLLMMLPIHLVIGVMEGLATATVISFVARARPAALTRSPSIVAPPELRRPALAGLLGAAALTGGILSWYASEQPDGLEWAIARVVHEHPLEATPSDLPPAATDFEAGTVLPPDPDREEHDPAVVRANTSLSGLIGGALSLGLAGLIGVAFRYRVRDPHRGDRRP